LEDQILQNEVLNNPKLGPINKHRLFPSNGAVLDEPLRIQLRRVQEEWFEERPVFELVRRCKELITHSLGEIPPQNNSVVKLEEGSEEESKVSFCTVKSS
jgi:hypothetical protein